MVKILVVGKANLDLVLSEKWAPKIGDRCVKLSSKGRKEETIRTDETPTPDNDKVNAVESMNGLIRQMKEGEDYYVRWGGGGNTSALNLATSSVIGRDLTTVFLNMTNPECYLGDIARNIISHGEANGLEVKCMNWRDLGFNLVIGGKSFKTVIRNPSQSKVFHGLTAEDKMNISDYVTLADGVLINALENAKVVSEIVQAVYNGNHEAEVKDSRRKYRRVLTVVTPSSAKDRTHFYESVMPYTGLIFNDRDIIEVFTNKKPAREIDFAMRKQGVLEAIAAMREGVQTGSGETPKISPENNIYVTLGARGILINRGNTYSIWNTSDKLTLELDRHILSSRLSQTGAGDASAAGFIYLETINKKTYDEFGVAMVMTMISRQLDLTRTINASGIKLIEEGLIK